ncbi:solute carrier family 25 member 44-like [Mercenaria mercenaria]|uniref:solute carrier family 25 member 44-like n=1 Tax=Mercenaria mercenaria TaxID=6596 RepID=UPI001E1DCAF3|nr:solute carrier family 25 member 44-like [Mercenaria mercenaria]
MTSLQDEAIVEDAQTIELHMMEMRKYLPMIGCSSLFMRTVLYPYGVIKTRLQIQSGKDVYKGTWDAVKSISRTEGIRGFYPGFGVYCFTIFPGMCYISSYEGVRHYMNTNTNWNQGWLKSLVGGGIASIVGQTLVVPIDIVNQHIMLLDRRKKTTSSNNVRKKEAREKLRTLQEIHIPDELRQRRFGTVRAVISHVYTADGLLGFYKGYFVSIATFAPNSALWWFFYEAYKEKLLSVIPEIVPRLFVMSCVAAPLAGVSSAALTNGVDVVRVRIQVKGGTVQETLSTLLREEGYKFWWKGLSARLLQSCVSSVLILSLYEPLKRWSLKEEFRDCVKW